MLIVVLVAFLLLAGLGSIAFTLQRLWWRRQQPHQQKAVPSTRLSSLYKHRRALISVGLFAMLLIALFVQSDLAGGGGLQGLTNELGLTFLRPNASAAGDMHIMAHPLPQTPSTRLVRLSAGSRDQYYTDYQFNVWSQSSCSGMAMAMVMNAYGRRLTGADVLQKEYDMGVWSIDLGLLREEGIAMTATSYGFTTDASHTRSLEEIITLANKGTPVIVSLRDYTRFPGGHFFVIRGGDDQYIYTADSSYYNIQRMTRVEFLNIWQSYSAILTPNA